MIALSVSRPTSGLDNVTATRITPISNAMACSLRRREVFWSRARPATSRRLVLAQELQHWPTWPQRPVARRIRSRGTDVDRDCLEHKAPPDEHGVAFSVALQWQAGTAEAPNRSNSQKEQQPKGATDRSHCRSSSYELASTPSRSSAATSQRFSKSSFSSGSPTWALTRTRRTTASPSTMA
ncbi:MAG: hypothetical protein ACI8UD_000741 [Planctomycetota bacterium]|jgi:hypothetical protein